VATVVVVGSAGSGRGVSPLSSASASPLPSPSASSPVTLRPPKLSVAAAILEDLDTGQVLYSKAPAEERPVASLTKIMSALVVLSSTPLNEVVVVRPEAVGQPGSGLGLQVGERLSVRDLLYGMLLVSANDAAAALAQHVGGTVEGFVRSMNREAEQIGLRHTHFAGPTGLDDRGYSSAADQARLIRRAYRNETFARVVATVRRRIPGPDGPRRLVNRNILLQVYPGAIGVKSGSTTRAGFCLAGAARLNGLGLLAVVLGSRTNAFDETIRLLNYGAGAFERATVLSRGQPVGRITLGGESIVAAAAREVTSVVRKDAPRSVEATFVPDPAAATPVVAGERIGRVEVRLNGRLVGVAPAVAVIPISPRPPATPPRRPVALPVVVRAILVLASLIRAAFDAFL
jgi:D-alanyl-D-alanine carboxypeptidase (penicillin-binding protein 5/6)